MKQQKKKSTFKKIIPILALAAAGAIQSGCVTKIPDNEYTGISFIDGVVDGYMNAKSPCHHEYIPYIHRCIPCCYCR